MTNTNVKFELNIYFSLSIDFSQGEVVHDFLREMQKISGRCKMISGEVDTSPPLLKTLPLFRVKGVRG
jgi:hypothetical protein